MKSAFALAALLVAAATPVLAGGKMTMESYRGELSLVMQREKNAKEALSQEQVRIEDLRQQNDDVAGRVLGTRREMYGSLGVSDNDVSSFGQRLIDTKAQLSSLLALPGPELLQSRGQFEGAKNQIMALRQEPAGKLPRFGQGRREVEEMIPQIEQRWVAETEAAKQAAIQEAVAAKEAAKAAAIAAKADAKAQKEAAKAAAIAAKAEAKAQKEAARAAAIAAKAAKGAKRPSVEEATPATGLTGDAETYTVESYGKSGDCLWKIAKKVYGDESRWEAIFEANRDVVKDPDVIQAGTTLRIPR